MQILRTIEELSAYLSANDCKAGCFADTSFLYGATHHDDRLFGRAVDVHELLSENSVSIYANVISRMEFIDLIFRRQIASGCASFFGELQWDAEHQDLYNLLKYIRDQKTIAERRGESFKVSESHMKKLRKLMGDARAGLNWKDFCAKYTGALLVSDWKSLEEDLGLNFVEILEGETSEFFKEPLRWNDMVQIMGKHGMRGPDAMISNLFQKSTFPLLITGDSDFESCFEDSAMSSKAVFVV